MRKKQFTEVFKQAISQHAAYIGVGVQTEGSRRPEIIINPNENFKEKLEYYRAAYDEDMALVSAKGKKDIRIVSVCWGDSFADIEFQMQVDRPDWKKTISDAVDRVVRRMFDGRLCSRAIRSSSFREDTASASRDSSQKTAHYMRTCSRPA